MKRVFFAILFILFIVLNSSNAQLIKSYSAKIAITSSTQKFEFPNPPFPGFGPDVQRRTGFIVAFNIEWFDIPFFSIISQVEYAQRGMGQKINITENSPVILGTKIVYDKLSYLSFPLLIKLSIPAPIIQPYIMGGPRLDILLSHKEDLPFFTDIYNNFKKSVMGASVGAGVEVKTLMPITFLIEARYNLDFSNSYDTDLSKIKKNSYDIWLGIAL